MTNNNELSELIRHRLKLAEQREHWGLCDPDWKPTPSGDTDVTRIWRKYGWKPLAELLEDKKEK